MLGRAGGGLLLPPRLSLHWAEMRGVWEGGVVVGGTVELCGLQHGGDGGAGRQLGVAGRVLQPRPGELGPALHKSRIIEQRSAQFTALPPSRTFKV